MVNLNNVHCIMSILVWSHLTPDGNTLIRGAAAGYSNSSVEAPTRDVSPIPADTSTNTLCEIHLLYVDKR